MSNKDPLDTEHGDTEFKEEEFDFGESESPEKNFSTPPSAGPGGSKKSGLVIVLISFILFLGYLSYRFLVTPKPISTVANVQAPKPKPTPAPGASDSIESALKTAPPQKSLVVVTPPPPPKNSIEDIQKDLFNETPSPPGPKAEAPGGPPVVHPTPEELQKVAAAQDALKQLNVQMENTVNALKALDSYTHDISNAVSQLNAQISAMDNRLLALSTTTNSLSKDVSTVRGDVGQVRRALGEEGLDLSTVPRRQHLGDQCPPSQDPEFVLHAVIPGRAWLRSAGGQIITVTEGEVIGSYGKVLVIDASNGIVLTNSGVTFR